MTVLTRIELDLMAARGCQRPECSHETHGEIYLHGGCHRGAATWTKYNAASGELSVECAACRRILARIAVAKTH